MIPQKNSGKVNIKPGEKKIYLELGIREPRGLSEIEEIFVSS